MNAAELIDRLTTLVKLQADIIKAQADALAQVGAVAMEEERADAGRTRTDLIGHDETPDEAEVEAERVRIQQEREAAALAEAAAAKW